MKVELSTNFVQTGSPERRKRPVIEMGETNIPWVGKAPKAWPLIRLRWTVLSSRNGIWGDEPDGEHDIPCVRVADFDRTRFMVADEVPTVRAVTESERRGRVLARGDLLLEKSGGGENQPVGAVAMYGSDRPAVCSNFLARVVPDPSCDSRFLTYLHAHLYSARVNVRSIKQTTGIQNLDAYSYFCERVPLPPLDEQRAIAAFLDRETARIDELIAKKERLIELLEHATKGLVRRFVLLGTSVEVEYRSSDVDWIGNVPSHWPIVPLRWNIQISSGDGLPTSAFETEKSVDHVVPVIGGNDVMGYTSLANVSSPVVAIGRVGAHCGNVHCVDPPAWITDNALVVDRFRGFDREYLVHVLRVMNLNRWASQNAQPLITGSFVKSVRVPCPSVAEQRVIVAAVKSAVAKYAGLMAKVTEAVRALREYRSALISAAVTGQIDVRKEVC